MRLDRALENQGHEPEECGHRSEHDRSEAPLGALDDRSARRRALPPPLIDEVHHDQGIVHHDAAEPQDAQNRRGGKVDPQYQVAQNHPHNPERNHGHDDERLGVGTQRNRQQREDHEHRDRETAIQ